MKAANMKYDENPYPIEEKDHHDLWEGLIKRDIDAFLQGDWDMTKVDFQEEGFFGIDGEKLDNPDHWKLNFPSLEAYKKSWLEQAKETKINADPNTLREDLYKSSRLKFIDIQQDHAVVHKEIKGPVSLKDGTMEQLDWQTLYICRKINDRWKITSFVGYLPSDMGKITDR